MLIDEARTREMLRRIVCRLSGDEGIREDLMQVATIHLWLIEARLTGQTVSWYLQSCKYHLQNLMASGKSIDAGKRRHGKVDWEADEAFATAVPVTRADGENVVGWVSARDMLAQLTKQLSAKETDILGGVVSGLGSREIGRNLGMSHQAVAKHRRKIARQAMCMGIGPAVSRPEMACV